MADTPETAAALRARLAHHQGSKARAEAERATLISERSELGSLLSDIDLDSVEAEIARLGDVIERADSRVALLRPALCRAAEIDADAERRKLTAGAGAQDVQTVAAICRTFGDIAGGAAAAELRAASIVPKPPNAKIFDAPPAPKMTRDDGAWWEARARREREAKAARLAASAGAPAPRSGSQDFPAST